MNIKEVLLWLFAIGPIIAMMYSYHKLPERCIVCINVAGVCRYGAKGILWGLSLVPIAFVVCITLYLHSDRRKYRSNVEIQRIALSVVLFMLGYMVALLFRSFDVDAIEIYNLVCFSLSILFATVGSALLKDRKDNPLEIKNTWTVKDIRVSDKSNILAGNMCIMGGLIQALGSIFLGRKQLFYVMILVFMVCLIVPNVMSCVWYKRYNK